METFRHLHVHSYYSLLDGFSSPEELVIKAKEIGHDALALTEHGNVVSMPEFYKVAKKNKIKPVLGCELYFTYDIDQNMSELEPPCDRTNYHIILLAKNNVGLKNLIKLSSVGAIKGLYDGRERIDLKTLEEYSDGIICSTACLGGIVSNRLLDYHYAINGDRSRLMKRLFRGIRAKKKVEEANMYINNIDPQELYNEAMYYASRMQEIFKDDFYIELQTTSEQDQFIANKYLIEIAEKLGAKTIITSDVHYANEEDYDLHDYVICIGTNKKKDDPDRMRYEPCYYMMTEDDVRNRLQYLPKNIVDNSIQNTYNITQMCDVNLDKMVIPFPRTVEDPAKHIKVESYRRLCKEYKNDEPNEFERKKKQLEYELDVIINAGFAPYFTMVKKYIDLANNQVGCMTGPGRGSACGSLVAYLLDITKVVDPIKNKLLFERFLNPERKEFPDIDTDFDYDKRDAVLQALKEEYDIASILTIGRVGVKTAIKDAAAVLGYNRNDMNEFTKQLDAKAVLSEEDIEKDEDLEADTETTEIVLNELRKKYPDVYHLAAKLIGRPRNYGVHASGVVITSETLTDYMPLKKATDKSGNERIVLQWDMNYAAEFGAIKFDVLGLKTLSIMKKCLRLANKEDIDLNKIDFEDPKLYKLICSLDTEGLFQIESEMFKGIIKEMKPNCFEDISALVALGRPGPLGAGLVDKFINRKHGKEKIVYDLQALEPILKDTYGVFVYQEQLMEAARVLAGYSLGQADSGIRKGIAKKKKAIIDENRGWLVYGKMKCNCNDPNECKICNGLGYITRKKGEELGLDISNYEIEGGIYRGHDEKKLHEIYDQMEKFGEYAFNKAHSAAYAVICLQTAYCKLNFPLEFYAAQLSYRNKDKIAKYVKHLRDKNIPVYRPNINKSQYEFSVYNDGIIYGLKNIPHVASAAEDIINEREKNGPFKSLEDLESRIKLKKNVKEWLLISGALDEIISAPKEKILELTKQELRKLEYEGFQFNFDPSKFEQKENGSQLQVTCTIKTIKMHKDKRQRDMAFMTIETASDGDEIEVVIFASTYAKLNKEILNEGNKIILKGKKDNDKIIADTITTKES